MSSVRRRGVVVSRVGPPLATAAGVPPAAAALGPGGTGTTGASHARVDDILPAALRPVQLHH